jgi:hypothetical protein
LHSALKGESGIVEQGLQFSTRLELRRWFNGENW